MRNRKTLPLDPVLLRIISKVTCNRMTADNIMRDADKYSSYKAAETRAECWRFAARELELMALEIMRWQKGDTDNHIFNYHQQVFEVDRPVYENLVKELAEPE